MRSEGDIGSIAVGLPPLRAPVDLHPAPRVPPPLHPHPRSVVFSVRRRMMSRRCLSAKEEVSGGVITGDYFFASPHNFPPPVMECYSGLVLIRSEPVNDDQ